MSRIYKLLCIVTIFTTFLGAPAIASAYSLCQPPNALIEVSEPGFLWWDGPSIWDARFGAPVVFAEPWFGKARYCVNARVGQWITVGAPYHETKRVQIEPYNRTDVWLYRSNSYYSAPSGSAPTAKQSAVPALP